MEYLDVVDEEDRVVGKELKVQKYATPFISRNVAIFIRDSDGNIHYHETSTNEKDPP